MRLIDADKLNKDIKENPFLLSETPIEFYERLLQMIDDQPTVFPLFASGRLHGKQVVMNYLNMCKVLDAFGIDSTDPANSLRFVLNQYQTIICELTNGFFSKLTYDADVVIDKVVEECKKDFEAELKYDENRSE